MSKKRKYGWTGLGGVQEVYADWLTRSTDPRTIVEKLKIPQRSYFGGKTLAAIVQGLVDPTTPLFLCQRF